MYEINIDKVSKIKKKYLKVNTINKIIIKRNKEIYPVCIFEGFIGKENF
jgi:hypothetical protein